MSELTHSPFDTREWDTPPPKVSLGKCIEIVRLNPMRDEVNFKEYVDAARRLASVVELYHRFLAELRELE